jgi:hypothetical protein
LIIFESSSSHSDSVWAHFSLNDSDNDELIYLEQKQAVALYTPEKLDCKGHVCSSCGKCCDWYYYVDDSDDNDCGDGLYTKHNGATCTYTGVGNNVVESRRRGRRYHSYGAICQCKDKKWKPSGDHGFGFI